MDHQSLLDKLHALFEIDPGNLGLESSIHDIPTWDSLTLLGLIAMIDEHYGVILAPKEVLACQTIGELLMLLDGKLATDT